MNGVLRRLPYRIYGGGDLSSLVPSKYPAALNGRPYVIADHKDAGWAHRSVAFLRQPVDQSPQPSEASLNPDGLWRRAQDSWHHGAGQTFRDRDEGDPSRFYTSKGIDVWTRYQFSLLPATDQKDTSSDTNLLLIVAGARLYKVEGSGLTFTADVTGDTPTWSATASYTGGAILSGCSDGFTVYITDGVDIWTTNTGTTTVTSVNTLNAGLLAYVKGRLMAAGTGGTKNSIYNITTIGTPPSALFDHPNTDFNWVGFAEGQAAIYAAGYSGDKSLIYRIPVKPDGSGLDLPVVAGELPDGEIIRSIGGYLGFILLGTDKGVRFCEADGNGNLTIGPYIATSAAVRCFEGQDRYVWFGWTNYDGTSTGLGRLDLTTFTENFETGARVPAYASDLMVTAQGNVLSVVTFQNIRVFAVSASGVWAQDTLKVASGTLRTGLIGYGIPDLKTVLYCDVRTTSLAGSYTVDLAADGAAFTQVGAESTAATTGTQHQTAETTAERFELQFTLTRDASATTTGPTITRYTLKALSGSTDGPGEMLYVPILLHEVCRLNGGDVYFDVGEELTRLKALRQDRTVVAYQEADQTYSVQLENYEWQPEGLRTHARSGEYITPNGIFLAQLKRTN